MGAEPPRGRGGRFNVDVDGFGLAFIFNSKTGSDGCSSDCSTAGGGRPRPMRPVSAMSASGVAASGAGAEGASPAGETVVSPF